MPPGHTLRTERLELVPATLMMLGHDRDDRSLLAASLNAVIPASWPPPLLDEGTMEEFIRMMREDSDPYFCSWYWVLEDPLRKNRTLIGSGGTGSCSGVPGAVMIGYSVLEEFRNRGYATEAVRHLTEVIFSWPGIRKVIATTYPELKASVRVLEKAGFVPAGKKESGLGIEEGTLIYVLRAPPTHILERK